MSPAGLLFRDAVWSRLMESMPWEPSRAESRQRGGHRGPAKQDQECIGAQRAASGVRIGAQRAASGVPQEKEEQTQKDVRVSFLLLDRRQGKTLLDVCLPKQRYLYMYVIEEKHTDTLM